MRRRYSGFTLVELLIAVAIMALLVAILIPTLSGIWGKSRELVDLANLRSTHSDFVAWAADRHGAIPNAGGPFETSAASRGYYGVFHNEDRGWGMYTLQNELWPNLLRQAYGGRIQRYWHSSYEDFTQDDLDGDISTLAIPDDGSTPSETDQNAPGSEPEPGIIGDVTVDDLVGTAMDYRSGSISHLQTEYRLGLTLLTDASVWSNPGAVRSTRWVRNYARRVRFTEVQNPSRKGLLYLKSWPRASEGWHHVAFVDGAVSIRNWADAMPTAVSPFDTAGEPGDPVNATFNGYRGIDF